MLSRLPGCTVLSNRFSANRVPLTLDGTVAIP
jgi:hypothetical protein